MQTIEPTAGIHATVQIASGRPTEFIDITERIQTVVAASGIRTGFVNVQTLHTTTAIVVNEHEPLLLGRLHRAARAHRPGRRALSARRRQRPDA